MDLNEFMADERLAGEYIKWINQPIAQVFLTTIEETFCKPLLPGAFRESINKESSSFCLGEFAGSNKVMSAIRNAAKHSMLQQQSISETYESEE